MVRVKVYCKSYIEKDVQNALGYLCAGHTKNVSLTADIFGVMCSTLCNHWLGHSVPAKQSQVSQQHLTPTEEITLCEWIVHQSVVRDIHKYFLYSYILFVLTTAFDSWQTRVISWKFLIKYYEYSFNYLIIIMNQLQLTLYLVYSTVCSLPDTDLRNLLSS